MQNMTRNMGSRSGAGSEPVGFAMVISGLKRVVVQTYNAVPAARGWVPRQKRSNDTIAA